MMRLPGLFVLFAMTALSVSLLAGASTSGESGAGHGSGQPYFSYARVLPAEFAQRVDMERAALGRAAEAGEAEAWGLGLALLLEMARSAGGSVEGAYALDTALDELVRARALGLLGALPDDRKAGLGRALAAFDRENPVGVRELVRGLTRRRLHEVRTRVLESDDPTASLDALLRVHGWAGPGGAGPMGRQRAEDRSAFRALSRDDVAEADGQHRWHLMLPPTEALAGVKLDDLAYRHERARGLAARLDQLWGHPDMLLLDNFVLNAAIRDRTGIIGLVHGDSFAMVQHDRMRRWRLREAMWRLGVGR